jgi:argininosuccinate synthase
MNTNTAYVKAASYEAKKGSVKHVLLLYSGGLDTSVMIPWLIDQYGVEVTTLTMDIGQQKDDLPAVEKKALSLGAKHAITLDVKEEFASAYIAKGIKANASYQGDYHLSTPIGRAITAAKAVEYAHKVGADAIAHGCTGKGNDQVRFEGYILTHDPKMKIIAPVREWMMDRNAEIAYANEHHIPVPASIGFPYSVDDNMWGMTWEGGEIEDPGVITPVEKFLTTYTIPEKAPDTAELVTIGFEKGVPVSLNGMPMTLATLIVKLNGIAGKHGVGIVQLVEDRLVGLKNGGVYELPAGHTIIAAHKALEQYVSTRELNELKSVMDIKWAYLCYGAKWLDPAMNAINAFNDQVNEKVTGVVTMKLWKGTATVVAMTSPNALAYTSFNMGEGYDYNVNASAGFIEVYSLQMKLANQIGK